MTDEAVLVVDQPLNSFQGDILPRAWKAGKLKYNHSEGRVALREDQLAIVKILGDENTLRPYRPFEHRLVRRSFCPIPNPLDVMAGVLQFGNNKAPEAFIHQIPHALFGRFRMRGECIPQMIGSEFVRRQHILLR